MHAVTGSPVNSDKLFILFIEDQLACNSSDSRRKQHRQLLHGSGCLDENQHDSSPLFPMMIIGVPQQLVSNPMSAILFWVGVLLSGSQNKLLLDPAQNQTFPTTYIRPDIDHAQIHYFD